MSDAAIIRLRTEGLACRVIAARLGITETDVHNCMRRNRLQGRFRAKHPYGGSSRPVIARTRDSAQGGHHEERTLTPLQAMVKEIDALYFKAVTCLDMWPELRQVEQIVIRHAEEADA